MPLVLLLSILAQAPPGELPHGCAWVRAENDAAGAGFACDVPGTLARWSVTTSRMISDSGVRGRNPVTRSSLETSGTRRNMSSNPAAYASE